MSDDPMRILVVEPTKDPYVKEIDGSLASMQAIVGGFIQAVEPFDDHNVLAQGSGEEFCSLTDKQIRTYTRLYSREKLFVMQHGKVINQPKKGKSTHER